jgi:TonB-linked SusC/RagA family outer membrane protein
MRKLILLLMASLLTTAFVQAQTREVTGTVVDSAGNPLAGASINVKGQKRGTSAGLDGSFRLTAPNNATLVVSAIGFLQQDVPVGSGSVSVHMLRDNRNLNEVVVTALGIRKEKRAINTAQQTINADEMNKSGTGNALGELEGKASGLTVIQSTGDPGGGVYIRLRGATSITGNNQPLLVVDGIPIDNSINNFDATAGAGNNSNGANGNLIGGQQPTNRGNDLNPNDVESINVLKGPAATALYGLQAASGAIVITTKKGGTGRRTAVNFNSSVTMDKVGLLPKLQNQWSQGTGGKYSPPEATGSTSWGAKIDTLAWDGATDYPFDKHGHIVGKSDPTAKIPVTPYDRYKFFKTGLTYNNNISLSGGNETSGYRMSLGNVEQTGIIPRAKYDKTTLSLSGNTKIGRLTTSAAINFIHSTNYKVQQGSNLSGVTLGLFRTPATFDNSNGYGTDGYLHKDAYELADGTQRTYRGGGGYDNPLWVVNNDPTHSNVDRVFGFAQADYTIAPWISLTYRLGGDVYAQNDKTSYEIGSAIANAGAVYINNYNVNQFNSDFIVNLHKNFGDDWQSSLVLGHNYFTASNNEVLTSGLGLNVPGFYDMSNAQAYLAGEVLLHKRTMAFYGDLELNYKRMLFLSVTARNEESSTLPAAHNTFFYPSVSVGWVFTELPGMKESNLLSYGKLRASFAQVGKDAPYYALTTPYTSGVFTDGFTPGITFPANGLSGYQISSAIASVGNSNLKPENTYSYEGGFDLGFLRNRLQFNATAYYSRTSDGILPVSLPFTTGFAAKVLNASIITNKGLELTLDGTPVQTSYGLKWNVVVNWSRNISKVVQLYPGIQSFFMGGFGSGGEAGIFAVPGAPFGVIYGNTTPHSNLNDIKSPLLIDDRQASNTYAQPLAGGIGPNLVLGNPAPDWTGAVISNLSYKGFMLGVQVDVRHGGAMWNGTRGALANKGTAQETSNRYTPTVFKGLLGHLDDNGNVVHFEGNVEKPGPGAANTIQSSYTQNYWQNVGNSFGAGQETDIENGGFTRIRQLSLTYELPRALLKKGPFTSLSLTFIANNLHVWTKYDGVDPETSLGGPSNVQGLDYFNNPNTKSYGLRLNFGL